MREVLDIYVRSLGEQGQAADAPEREQDLGTFVCWLLRRHGYELHYLSYGHRGPERQRKSGHQQWGVDIIASRPDPDGASHVYRFVLKQGDVGLSQWTSDRGSIPHDLLLASGRMNADDERHEPNSEGWQRATVVAVHNGDLDTEQLGSQVRTLREELVKSGNVDDVLWWQAKHLVDLALSTPDSEPGSSGLEEAADASLFPPNVAPFARLVLDSLHRDTWGIGRSFDAQAADLLIEHVLPLARPSSPAEEELPDGPPMSERRLYRGAAELALLCEMLVVESRRVAQGNTLPVFHLIERVLVRIVEHARRIKRWQGHKAKISQLVRLLGTLYVSQARTLVTRLRPLLGHELSLAVPANSERIDYPFRVLHLSGVLATAGLVADALDDESARVDLANALEQLWDANASGALSPVCDDQLIEIATTWYFLLQAGYSAEVASYARQLVMRLGIRRRRNLPLPATWIRSRTYAEISGIGDLIQAHLHGADSTPDLGDKGSTIIPFCLYVAHRGGAPIGAQLLEGLQPVSSPNPAAPQMESIDAVYPQSWQPPVDAASEWYVREIAYRGLAKVYDITQPPAEIVAAFESFHESRPESPAASLGFEFVDWMAWRTWRTPPPMALFVDRALWATESLANRFPIALSQRLALGAGYVCSRPGCGRSAFGPKADVSVPETGVAAAIVAIPPRGSRKMLDEQANRVAEENALWLCRRCARLIDAGHFDATATTLRAWKTKHEQDQARTAPGKASALDREIVSALARSPDWEDLSESTLLTSLPPANPPTEVDAANTKIDFTVDALFSEDKRAVLLVGRIGNRTDEELTIVDLHLQIPDMGTYLPSEFYGALYVDDHEWRTNATWELRAGQLKKVAWFLPADEALLSGLAETQPLLCTVRLDVYPEISVSRQVELFTIRRLKELASAAGEN